NSNLASVYWSRERAFPLFLVIWMAPVGRGRKELGPQGLVKSASSSDRRVRIIISTAAKTPRLRSAATCMMRCYLYRQRSVGRVSDRRGHSERADPSDDGAITFSVSCRASFQACLKPSVQASWEPCFTLGEDSLHDVAVHVGKPILPSLITEGEPRVIDAA